MSNTTAANRKFPVHNPMAYLKGMDKIFLLTIILPTFLSIVYYGFIASDVYISESRFVVRSAERQSKASPLGMLFEGSGFSRAQDDSYVVQDFMTSRDALQALNDKLAIKKAFSSPTVDIFSRFAGLDWDDSFEALHLYYLKRVGIEHDGDSSITTLTVSSFTAEEAYQINQQLLEMGEALVNQLNVLGQQDMIRFATQEMNNAEKKAKAAALALSVYRNQKGVIDPEAESSLHLEQIAKMQESLISAQSQLSQLKTFTKNNPQIPSLELLIQNLKQEIDAEIARVTGGGHSLAHKAAEYQRLVLEREFAAKQLESTLTSLEEARSEAVRQQLYLERIVQPNKPDKALEPKRLRGVIVTLVLGVIAWGILTMFIAGVKEHHD